MKHELDEAVRLGRTEIAEAPNPYELQNLRSKYLGKKSVVMGFMKRLGELEKDERPAFGKVINEARDEIEAALNQREEYLREQEYASALEDGRVDVTMPGRRGGWGSMHPINLAWREIEDIFLGLGFEIAEGNDIEDEYHNFDALNHPYDHPARELSDTFYLDKDVLLRTHTSPVQIRVMENHKPPIKIISPGRVFRNDNDASHSPAFHQVEALVVDEGVTFPDLRDMLNIFVREYFGSKISSRIRPHFFPFTEPSAEIDIVCVRCEGRGCPLCKGSGWLEMGGAGMVDPNVFQFVGLDPERYTGYAFGLGIDRIAMLKYRIPDMRLMFENDIRFLRRFTYSH